ncbi:MAG: hypothetical protein ABRQ37_17890, partial [Candidatus Eremiobacterota bacterium]
TCNISGNTEISENDACTYDGGGIHNIGKCTITDCTITYNQAKNQGGGISNAYYEFDSGKVTGDCTISRTSISGDTTGDSNAANAGGGIYNEAICTLASAVTIKNNIAVESGGGIYNSSEGKINFGTAPGVIKGNHADFYAPPDPSTGGTGGGIYDGTNKIPNPPVPGIFGTNNFRGSDEITIDNINGLP